MMCVSKLRGFEGGRRENGLKLMMRKKEDTYQPPVPGAGGLYGEKTKVTTGNAVSSDKLVQVSVRMENDSTCVILLMIDCEFKRVE